jgi:hypothetical protein
MTAGEGMIKIHRLWTVLSVLACFVALPVNAAPLTMLEFRAQVRGAIEARAPRARIDAIDERTLAVKLPGGGPNDEFKVMLESAYGRYLNNPAGREAVIDQLVRVLDNATTEPKPTPDNVVILVRPADYFETAGLSEIKTMFRPFGDGFIELIAMDLGETFRVGGAEDLLTMFKDPDTAWRQAAANTRSRNVKYDIEAPARGLWMISSASSLAPYFVETPDLWAANGVTIKGDPIAVFLQRNLLLLADGGDKDLRAGLAMFLDNAKEDPETISTTMYIRRSGVWSILKQGQ